VQSPDHVPSRGASRRRGVGVGVGASISMRRVIVRKKVSVQANADTEGRERRYFWLRRALR
jgi:hypothetical protein